LKGRTWLLILGIIVLLALGAGGWVHYGKTPTESEYTEQTINRYLKNKDWTTLRRLTNNDKKLLKQLKKSGRVEIYEMVPEMESNFALGGFKDADMSIGVKLKHERVGFLGLYDSYKISWIDREN